MSSPLEPRETLESCSGDRLEDHTTIGSGELDDDSYSDDESETCSDEDDDDDDDDDSDSDSYDEEEPEENDEVDSYVVAAVTKKSSPKKRTEEQHEQQRRIVNLAASTFSDTEPEYSHTHTTTTRSFEGGEDGNTFTDDDHGDVSYYTTTQDEANTMTSGGYGDSSCQSVASQSTATTQITSPGRTIIRKQPSNHRQSHGDDDDFHHDANNLSHNSSLVNSTMTTPDVHNRSSPTTDRHRSPLSTPHASNNSNSTHVSVLLLPPPPPPPPPLPLHQPPLSPRHHERVPGGAAAKRMLLGPKGSKESEDSVTGRGVDIDQANSAESLKVDPGYLLVAERQRAKEEFCTVKSPSKQDRFQFAPPPPPSDIANDDMSEVQIQVSTAPSFLNRSEIFHESPHAAISALLRPTSRPSPSLVVAGQNTTTTTTTTTTGTTTSKSPSFFPNTDASPRAIPKSFDAVTPIVSNHGTHSDIPPDVGSTLLSKETELKLEQVQSKMIDPTPTLTDLLTAIASPQESALLDPLAYAVRRKNACGVVQTLTANTSNRVRICWTAGVLPALTSVLQDGLAARDGSAPSKISQYSDARIGTEYEAARNRAISALMNLSMPVKNRLAVFHSPGLVHTVLQTIEQDHGLARRGCCAVLAFLAKSSENRLLLAQVPCLMDILRKVLKPRPPRVEPVTTTKEKKVYPWSDDDDEASSSSESCRSPSKEKSGRNSFLSSKASGGSYDDSGATPRVEGAQSPREISGYDETADDLLQAARQNLFAMVGHLVKEKDNAYHFARDLSLLTTMVEVSRFQESPSHALAVKVLAHLTRHRLNKVLAFKPKSVVPALIEATQSPNDEARLFACYALQNLSQEKSCRQELAIAAHLIEVLCDRCRNGAQTEERLAAISTLKNLCDEPANLIPMTNTTGCISTLMYLAHTQVTCSSSNTKHGTTPKESAAVATPPVDVLPVSELMQYRACDALATLSHWLRKIATSGHSLDATRQGRPPIKGLFVPSLREVSWNQWT